MTPNRLRKAEKKVGAENPQAADDKAEKHRNKKKEEFPESSPEIIRDQLMQSFSNKEGDEPNKINWAVFTRC